MADLSPDDEAVLKEYILEVMKTVPGATPAVPVPPAAPEPQPLKMQIGGQEYTFKDATEAQAQINQVLQLAQQEVVKSRQTAPPPPAKVAGDDAPSFNMDKYASLIQEDVPKGLEYGLQSVFGVENPGKAFRDLLQKTQEVTQKLAIYEFQDRHPELKGQLAEVGGTIDNIRRSLNLGFDANGLDAAYVFGVQKGLIKAQAPQTPAAPEPVNPHLAPLPNVSRGGDNNLNLLEEQVEEMSIPQLEALQRKYLRGL